MSGALVFAALKCKIPDPLTKLVLICVCDRFNEDLGYAWCSVDHIAEYCACSPRTVRYRLKELQVAGILEVEARDGNTNCYRIVHSRGAANGAGLHEVQLGAANGAAITSYELLTKKRRGGKTKLVDWKPDKEFNKEEWAKLSDSMQAHYDNMRPTANPHYREKHGI